MRRQRWIGCLVFVTAVALLLVARAAYADCQANCTLVNTAADTVNATCACGGVGTCSLRDALTKACSDIQFAIGTGHQTITLMSDLPDIDHGVIVDGTTQPGFAGVPLIEVRRGDSGTATHGFRTRNSQVNDTLTLKSLIINHFNGQTCNICAGVIFSDPSDVLRQGGHTIKGCYIGTDATGMVADGNTVGIQDNSLGANTFGGTTPAERNVISGNITAQIEIGRSNTGYSVQNVIQGNYIGLSAAGSALQLQGGGSNGSGILTGPPYPGFSPGILIGGSAPGSGNVIATNTGTAIQMTDGINNVIEGNLIGLDATGMNVLPSDGGIDLEGETNATILNNVIAGSTSGPLINLSQDPATLIPTHGTIIQGNYLGTDITGNRALPSLTGISIASGAPNNTIGGPGAGQGNVIGGTPYGIQIFGLGNAGNVIQGNRIGIGVTGSPIPNATGIAAFGSNGGTVIGGINPGEGNTIAFNTQSGVDIQFGSGNVIRGNSIYGNGAQGIDFVFPFSNTPYPNDVGDADTGPNGLQNFPILTSVTFPDVAHVRIVGTLNSKPTTHYTLDFYSNPPPIHPQNFLEGQIRIGLFDNPAITDSQGNLNFDVTLPVSGFPNVWVSATATDDAANTSEFSQRSLFAIMPTHGPASAGIPFTLAGQLFQPGATVSFGGPPGGFATGINVASATQITGLTPALMPGALYGVTVTNPDTSTAVMQKAYLADFNDVPLGSTFYPSVTSLALDGVTGGCGGGNYCPGNNVTRAQMAVFLLKAKYGPWWVPPPATGTVFLDVPLNGFAAAWIEELFHEGITGGCGGGNYCPNNPVTRQQMAVFLLKTEHGSSYVPPACTGIFGDVACPSTFANWIEQLFHENITSGCGGGNYCPASNVTRGQMAVFIVKTFQLP
jgi:hypothetical protein